VDTDSGEDMPLVSCVECDHPISTEARACPSCGHPVDRPPRLALVWACRTLLAVTALYLFYNAFILFVMPAVPLLVSFWRPRWAIYGSVTVFSLAIAASILFP
jgi:hypothetical protein